MVARQTQSPRSTGEKVARLAERHEELRRAASQGASTLRNPDGSVLTVDGGGDTPQLSSPVGNVGLRFAPTGTLSAVTADGGTAAPFSAAGITGTDRATFPDINLTGGAIFSLATDGAVRFHSDADGGGFDSCNRAGTEYRGMRSSNFATVTPSWRGVKVDHRSTLEYLGRSAADVVDGLEVGAWRYDPDLVPPGYSDNRTHYGLMLDELPVEFTRTHPTADGRGWITAYDRDEVLNLALAAVQDRGREIESLRGEVRELRALLEAHVNPAA